MKSKLVALGVALALFSPGSASAFSFGSFLAGEMIASIKLAETTVTFTAGTGVLVLNGWVSEINTNLGNSYTPGNNDVIFDSQVSLVSEFNLPPSFVSATFDSVVADITILDQGTGGSGLIYAADWDAPGLDFSASMPSSEVIGSLVGNFTTRAGEGDADFEAAMGSIGDILANLGNFTSNGSGVTVIDDLIQAGCIPFVTVCTLDNFVAQATVNIDPPAAPPPVPEPSVMMLLACGLVGLAVRSRRA